MITPTDSLTITSDTTLTPGVYFLPGGLSIAADNVTLDGNGALLIGQNRQGRGLTIEGRGNVTVKNLRLAEYEHGIYARDCRGLTLRDCEVRATAEAPVNTEFLDIWRDADKSYGGGILLRQVTDSLITANDLSHQMTGLYAYGCNRLTVRGNIANSCSGWGFHLFETCDSTYEDNCADFCCRWEPRGDRAGHMGADAAGFLIVHASCRNVFRRNLARMGGDGFFLAGLTPDLKPVGCDDNLFEQNDGSWSPNIAFEATFSRGNNFRDNFANRCNYGFWLGFSRDGLLENNQVNGNRQAGIAVENGVGFRVTGNTFQANTHGILLWSKRIADFEKPVPENDTSRDWLIEGNTFNGNTKAIRIAADQDHGIRPLPTSGEWGLPAPRPRGHVIRRNRFEKNIAEYDFAGAEETMLEENEILKSTM
jgi:parallel beta-helix repeat protein